MSKLLAVGKSAPDFTLKVTPDQSLSLNSLQGKRVILAFYPADWSPVCSDELVVFNEILPEFRNHNTDLLGISVDGTWCHIAFSKHRHFQFPLLSDFEPKGAVAKKYGAYRENDGYCERALFLIDNKGVIAWNCLCPVGESPGADGVLNALEKLSKEEKNAKNTSK